MLVVLDNQVINDNEYVHEFITTWHKAKVWPALVFDVNKNDDDDDAIVNDDIKNDLIIN